MWCFPVGDTLLHICYMSQCNERVTCIYHTMKVKGCPWSNTIVVTEVFSCQLGKSLTSNAFWTPCWVRQWCEYTNSCPNSCQGTEQAATAHVVHGLPLKQVTKYNIPCWLVIEWAIEFPMILLYMRMTSSFSAHGLVTDSQEGAIWSICIWSILK